MTRRAGWLRRMPLACALVGAGAAAWAQSGEVVIGQVVSRADGLADIGREIALGARACAQAVNAGGGLRGRALRLVSADDGGVASAALALAKGMAERDDIVALLTPMGRGANGSLLPWATGEGLAVVAPYGAGALSSQAAALSSSFFLRTHASVEALRLATQVQTLGIERVAILYADDELGRETLAAFEEAIASTGHAAVALVPLHGQQAGEAVRALDKSSPQAVLLATVGEQTQAVLRALEALALKGRKIVRYALSSAASQQELRSAGPAARWLVVSQVLPSPRAQALPLIKAYQAAMRAAGDAPLSYPTLEGCVAVLTLAQVLRRSGEPPTRAGVLRALRGAGVVDLGGWSVDLADRQRPGSRFTDITLVGADGGWVR